MNFLSWVLTFELKIKNMFEANNKENTLRSHTSCIGASVTSLLQSQMINSNLINQCNYKNNKRNKITLSFEELEMQAQWIKKYCSSMAFVFEKMLLAMFAPMIDQKTCKL